VAQVRRAKAVCAGSLGYPFYNKKRKSQINTFSLPTSMSDGEEMELREQSFTHFWNGYPQEQIQEEVAAVALVSPPGWERAVSQLLPRRFLPCFDAFRPGPTLPPLAGKPTTGSPR